MQILNGMSAVLFGIGIQIPNFLTVIPFQYNDYTLISRDVYTSNLNTFCAETFNSTTFFQKSLLFC